MMILETLRTKLRKAKLDDVEFIFKLLNEQGFIDFIGDRGIRTLDDAKRYIEAAFFTSYSTHGLCSPFLVTDHNNQQLGIAGFYHRPALQHPDLGFAFLKAVEGQGLAFEACHALLSFAQQELHLTQIEAILKPSNRRSKSLLDRLGFKSMGQLVINQDKERVLVMSICLQR